jgi:hypothetical protein
MLLWGIGDASLFFIAPEVGLSYAALRYGLWRTLVLGLFVTIGAFAGGLAMYFLADAYPAEVRNLLLKVPGINADLLAEVRGDLRKTNAVVVLASAYSLTPFKAAAAEAAGQNVQIVFFALETFFAYLSRAFMAALVFGFIGWALRKSLGWKTLVLRAMILWALWYAAYFVIRAG